jgi:hypothetical protein
MDDACGMPGFEITPTTLMSGMFNLKAGPLPHGHGSTSRALEQAVLEMTVSSAC